MNLIWLDSLPCYAKKHGIKHKQRRNPCDRICFLFSSILWLVVLLHRHHYHHQWVLCFLPATSFVVLCKQSLLDPKLHRNLFFLAHNYLL